MEKPCWRDRKIDAIETLYGTWYDKYIGEEDDRGLYCNIYKNIIHALKTLPEEPDNYVCVAMNKAINEDLATMQRIVIYFETNIPSWFKLTEWNYI